MNKLSLILSLIIAPPLFAGEADVIKVQVDCDTRCNFQVTLKHADTGWDHYADQWDVVAPDGRVLGKRVLYHPHVDEQPFTRSLSGVSIPDGIDFVFIRARDSVHNYGGVEKRVDLPGR